jgi:two-component system NtrC family sensor kinase
MNDSSPVPGAPALDTERAGDAGHGRVLLVEDDPEVAAATLALVESFGWAVAHAPQADAALEIIDEGLLHIDVVLADIAMPGEFDGMELAVHLRRMRPELRVVLMTGYTTEVHRAAWDGFELLPKPCAPSLLARTLLGRR